MGLMPVMRGAGNVSKKQLIPHSLQQQGCTGGFLYRNMVIIYSVLHGSIKVYRDRFSGHKTSLNPVVSIYNNTE